MLDKTDGRILAGDWTEIRTSDLKRLWVDGKLSASRIADELGGVSRNAVLGKIHRLGLSRPKKRRKPSIILMLSREERVRRQAERVLLRRVAQAQPLPDPAPLSPDFLNLTFDQLTFGWDEATEKLIAKECRYPIGDRAPFLYCGQPTVRDSYCAHCFKVTHAPGRAA